MDGKTLFAPFCDEPILENFKISKLCNNSQLIKKGDVFLAYPGHLSDGRKYLNDAIERKAVAIVCEKSGFEEFKIENCPVPIILIDKLSTKLAAIASAYHHHPAQSMRMQGITGTNGKTTVSHLLNQTLMQLKIESALIGTLGVESPKFSQALNLTTPDALDLQRLLATLNENGVEIVNMEVSSHALTQGRVAEVPFKTAIFTNLTPEHLDYHKDMNAYCEAKSLLFQNKSLEHAILNDEDAYTVKILRKVNPKAQVCLVSTKDTIQTKSFKKALTITTRSVQLGSHGIEAVIDTPWGQGSFKTKLIGIFNLSNCLMVVGALCMQGYALEAVLAALGRAQPVKGRMQAFGGASLPKVYVDYAHTPDALEQALKAARSACKRRLWCVFGCGGNRDKDKRKLMGEVASKYSDRVIITNDNPRYESPQVIIEDILSGIDTQNVHVEQDRKKAIEHAVLHALSFDVILVAGKGHEAMQTVQGQQTPFSDIEWVKKILGDKK